MPAITSEIPKSLEGRIRCTYESCYRHFENDVQMRKHKAKDKSHDFYCKKCDADCEDDTEYLIHQLTSPRHIPCPLCGKEFASRDGRDRHVGIYHRVKQDLPCPGCQKRFDAASAMMAHIERDECEVISKNDFHKHRNEQQLQKEALENMEGSGYHGGAAQTSTTDSETGGVDLLDRDVRVVMSSDGDDSVWDSVSATGSTSQNFSRGVGRPGTIFQAVDSLSLHKYPPLHAQARRDQESETTGASRSLEDSLLDTSEPQIKPTVASGSQSTVGSVWTRKRTAWPSQQISPYRRDPTNKLDYDEGVSTISTNLLGTQVNAVPPHPSSSIVVDRSVIPTSQSVPPSVRPDTKQPNQRITVAPAPVRLHQNDIQQYWSPIEHRYICPGQRCGLKFPSPASFEAHLLTGVHMVGTVQCPSCLKRFKTTTGLIAHIESGSVKCDIKQSAEFDLILREISAGLLGLGSTGADGFIRYKSIAPSEW